MLYYVCLYFQQLSNGPTHVLRTKEKASEVAGDNNSFLYLVTGSCITLRFTYQPYQYLRLYASNDKFK